MRATSRCFSPLSLSRARFIAASATRANDSRAANRRRDRSLTIINRRPFSHKVRAEADQVGISVQLMSRVR